MKTPKKPLKSPADVPKPEIKRRGGGKPFRSKLEPYFEEIRAARKARKTWAEIADSLKDRVETTPQGVHYFFKSKRRKKYALGMEPEEEPTHAASVASDPHPSPSGTNPQPTASDEYEPDVYDQAVAAHQQKQAPKRGPVHLPPGTII